MESNRFFDTQDVTRTTTGVHFTSESKSSSIYARRELAEKEAQLESKRLERVRLFEEARANHKEEILANRSAETQESQALTRLDTEPILSSQDTTIATPTLDKKVVLDLFTGPTLIGIGIEHPQIKQLIVDAKNHFVTTGNPLEVVLKTNMLDFKSVTYSARKLHTILSVFPTIKPVWDFEDNREQAIEA
ncbi:hypothetical protein KC678_04380 [Candidatus Dojkabacteria bacterium]|uniref:Uncharacterized protein n=1 Tax=Candidatus Dojkabacteria bacterium TaxID=2099670 RepID=A0A955RGJ6_9BACT|nr:hypothetical protein [Candidatus Dojkabacteria bacterium]